MGIKTVAIHSDVDASSVSMFLLYLNQNLICSLKKKKVKDVSFFSPAWPEKDIYHYKTKQT